MSDGAEIELKGASPTVSHPSDKKLFLVTMEGRHAASSVGALISAKRAPPC